MAEENENETILEVEPQLIESDDIKLPENAKIELDDADKIVQSVEEGIEKLPEDEEKVKGFDDEEPKNNDQLSDDSDDFDNQKKFLRNVLESSMWEAIDAVPSCSDTSIPKPPPCTPTEDSVHELLDINQLLPFIYQDYSSITTDIDHTLSIEAGPMLKEERLKVRRGPELEIVSSLEDLELKECLLYGKVEDLQMHRVIEKKKALGITVTIDIETKPSSERISSVATIKWPRISEFTIEVGESSINDFILTWSYDEKWLYCVDFLIAQSDEYSDYYLYEVKWSIPTNQYPIPQATASVFFTIEVSRFKPTFCPVQVSYVFESSKLVHSPGEIQFKESFLFDIIDAKLCLYKSFTKAMEQLTSPTIDDKETEMFNKFCSEWWDLNGPAKILHEVSKLLIPYVQESLGAANNAGENLAQTDVSLKGIQILDAGCGGGIVSEGFAKAGATVVGVDVNSNMIDLAKKHASISSTPMPTLTYVWESIEDHAKTNFEKYDVVISNFVLEHINEVEIYLKACADCLKPGGLIFVSTIGQT
ncbi:hypothetical protein FQR65_LT05303 [Abscondita terminalis]|nr:hypothetical protein FQR65_LT05303 [Abscondita terminalis]